MYVCQSEIFSSWTSEYSDVNKYSHGRTATPAIVTRRMVGSNLQLIRCFAGHFQVFNTAVWKWFPGGGDVVDPHEGGDDLVLLSDRGPRVVILLLFGELEECKSAVVDTGDELVPASSS